LFHFSLALDQAAYYETTRVCFHCINLYHCIPQ